MRPDFSKLYRVTIKKWKPNESKVQPFIYNIEDIVTTGQDISEAFLKGEEYIALCRENSEWRFGEVIKVDLQGEVFLGIKIEEEITEILPGGILKEGFKGMPCQEYGYDDNGTWRPK